MKKNIYITAVFLVSLAIFSCKKTGSGSGKNVNAAAPTVSTNDATNLNGTTATIGGNITNDGGSIVTEAGICYGDASGVDTSKNKKATYPISGSFSIGLTGLTYYTTYYYKAYAINDKGLTYGEEKSFTPVPPYSSASAVAAANLKAYWAFENGYADSVSSTIGTANHPTAISFVTGIRGQAAEIASPGYINSNIGSTVAGLQDFTYVLWIKQPASLASGPTTYFPFSLNAAGFSWENTKFFMLFNNADNATNSYGKIALQDQWFDPGQVWPKMLDGSWHQMAISFNGSSGALRVYVDGLLLSQSSSTTFNAQANFGSVNSFTLGGPDDYANTANGWMNSLSGDLDEFKIYNKELTADEVISIYGLQAHGSW
ncbi:MAG TPA: LamG-like jellyroll fold domain-containing protein [Puia sp.]|nr:LamG-like jellyroll fold domain-containing protein [Puia sp.]